MSYNTVNEANDIIANYYVSTAKERIFWDELSNGDKSVLLNRAFEKIERLPFIGRKLYSSQETAFPRKLRHRKLNSSIVRTAEVIEALSIAGALPEQRRKGLKSFTIGHLSETYASPSSSSPLSPVGEMSDEALHILGEYLSGGYDIWRL